ncbi:hypothetical protein LCGC14_1541320 [marine sediment metagenome]|uniref:Uncharacterized protein n=1 Tax=marine sediment metagenome TaxID=412755 RepID=A0A0F9LTQ8_9ZZZZ
MIADDTPLDLSDLSKLEDFLSNLRFDVTPEVIFKPRFVTPDTRQQAQQVNQVIQQTQQQQTAAVAQAQWVQQFEETHKGWIANGGQITPGNLTADGERLMQHAGAEVQRGRSQAEALHYGLLALQAEKAQQQPATPAVPPVKPQGHHKPAVAAAPAPNAEDVYKKRLETLSFGDHVRADWRDREAAAGATG